MSIIAKEVCWCKRCLKTLYLEECIRIDNKFLCPKCKRIIVPYPDNLWYKLERYVLYRIVKDNKKYIIKQYILGLIIKHFGEYYDKTVITHYFNELIHFLEENCLDKGIILKRISKDKWMLNMSYYKLKQISNMLSQVLY